MGEAKRNLELMDNKSNPNPKPSSIELDLSGERSYLRLLELAMQAEGAKAVYASAEAAYRATLSRYDQEMSAYLSAKGIDTENYRLESLDWKSRKLKLVLVAPVPTAPAEPAPVEAGMEAE